MGEYIKVLKPKQSLNIHITTLRLFGTWPPKEDPHTWRTTLYKCWAVLFLGFVYVGQLCSEFANIISVWGNFQLMIEGSFLFLTHVVQIVKFRYFIGEWGRVSDLVDMLNSEIFLPKHPNHVPIIEAAMRWCRIQVILFYSMAVATVMLWALFPIYEETGDVRKLPCPGWYPFRTDQTPVYEITFAHQICITMVNALSNIAMDTFVTAVMTHVCAQLQILKDSLTHLKERAWLELHSESTNTQNLTKNNEDSLNYNNYSAVNGLNFPDAELEAQIIKKFIDCIHHHMAILSFVDEMEKLFNAGVLAQFVSSTIIICVTAFELTVVPIGGIQFYSMVLYQSCMLYEIFIYCYHGNEIMLESLSLPDAVYEAEWYTCSEKIKKLMKFFLLRTSRPIIVRAGYFFGLTLGTFTAILRSSYSYFAVLQRVND